EQLHAAAADQVAHVGERRRVAHQEDRVDLLADQRLLGVFALQIDQLGRVFLLAVDAVGAQERGRQYVRAASFAADRDPFAGELGQTRDRLRRAVEDIDRRVEKAAE